MASTRNADRIWLFAGAVVILLLIIASYLLLIRPKYFDAADVRGQADDAQTQLVSLRQKIAELDRQRSQLPALKTALAVSRRALPADSGVPDFLRQLQRDGDNVGVSVTGIGVAAPEKSKVAPDVWELPITLSAEGDPPKLSLFLTQLQTAQARAVLVKSVNLVVGAAATGSSSTTVPSSINLLISAYMAPPAGGGVPIVTTK